MSLRADIETGTTGLTGGLGLPLALPLLIGLHGAVAVILGQLSAFPFNSGMAQILATLLLYCIPWFLLALLIRKAVLLAAVEKSTAPTRDMMAAIRAVTSDRERLLGGALKLGLVCFFIGASSYIKEMITVLQPFAWDETFAQLDRVLHFGTDPYRLTLWLFGSATATTALNIAYHAWFFLIYFTAFIACFARTDDRMSQAFLIGLVLTFAIGGNALAVAFSSAGPVYFERLGFGAEFEPLMQHLRGLSDVTPVPALAVQEELWAGHVAEGRIAGISAMPSMHVATSVLMALYAASYARWAGWLMWTFAATIMVGSVHLGWHYAVDGYLGALIAWGCWIGGRHLARADPLARQDASQV